MKRVHPSVFAFVAAGFFSAGIAGTLIMIGVIILLSLIQELILSHKPKYD